MDRRLHMDFRSPVPSYVQLADQLRDAITSGEIAPDEALPSLAQLATETGLSMATVKRAVKVLAEEGLVYSISGRGRFAAPGDSDR
jgi:GntR family transcriptional regulator